MDEYLELISVNGWHIIITILNLLILFWIIKRFLFKPVQKVLDERKNQVEKIYSDAQSAREKAQKDRDEYSKKLQSADEQALAIIKEASDKARTAGDRIIDEANEKAGEIRKKAEDSIALERKSAENELKDEISTLSVAIAQKIVEREISPEDNKNLIDSFIDGIGGDDNG